MYKKNGLNSWITIITSSLFFLFSFLQTNIFNTIGEFIKHDFHINSYHISLISSLYFYGNIIMLIPAGILVDIFSSKKIIVLSLLFMIINTMIEAFANNIYIIAITRFFIGISSSFSLISNLKISSYCFSKENISYVSGVIITIGMLGGLIAQTPFILLKQYFAWRMILLILSIIGLFILILTLILVKDFQYKDKKINNKYLQKNNKKKSYGKIIKEIFAFSTNIQNWYLGFFICFFNAPMFILGALWGEFYLIKYYHISKLFSSYIISMLFFGSIIGYPIIGKLSDILKMKKILMVTGSLITFILFSITILLKCYLNKYILLIIFFIIGFNLSVQGLVYSILFDINDKKDLAKSNSLISILTMLGGGLAQSVFGYLINNKINIIVIPGSILIAYFISFLIEDY